MWQALIELVKSYSARYRAQTEGKYCDKPLPEGGYAKFTAWSTFAAAIFAFIAAVAFWCQFWAIKDDTINANRAWIILDTPQLRVGHITPERITLDVGMKWFNGGKGPAGDARSNLEPIWLIPVPTLRKGGVVYEAKNLIIPPNDTCKRIDKSRDRGVIWPQEPKGDNIMNDPVEVPKDFWSGHLVYGFQGCATYESFGETRQTRVCEFLTRADAPLSKWQWSFCPGPGQNDAT